MKLNRHFVKLYEVLILCYSCFRKKQLECFDGKKIMPNFVSNSFFKKIGMHKQRKKQEKYTVRISKQCKK